jgi:hypothetical protein
MKEFTDAIKILNDRTLLHENLLHLFSERQLDLQKQDGILLEIIQDLTNVVELQGNRIQRLERLLALRET